MSQRVAALWRCTRPNLASSFTLPTGWMARSPANAAWFITAMPDSVWRHNISLIRLTSPISPRLFCVPVKPTVRPPCTSSPPDNPALQTGREDTKFCQRDMNLSTLATTLANRFPEAYVCEPHWLAAAPGRVNVIGEHTDYNDGFVLPIALDRYTVVAAGPSASAGRKIRLRSTTADAPVV